MSLMELSFSFRLSLNRIILHPYLVMVLMEFSLSQSVDAEADESTPPESTKSTIEDELSTMTASELNKRFVVSFLNVHGR